MKKILVVALCLLQISIWAISPQPYGPGCPKCKKVEGGGELGGNYYFNSKDNQCRNGCSYKREDEECCFCFEPGKYPVTSCDDAVTEACIKCPKECCPEGTVCCKLSQDGPETCIPIRESPPECLPPVPEDENTINLEKSLWVGPGAYTSSRSEVLKIPNPVTSLMQIDNCQVPPHPEATNQTSLQGSVAQLIGNNNLHVCGGFGKSGALAACYNYIAGHPNWILGQPMNYHRARAAAIQQLVGHIQPYTYGFWVTGGYDDNNSILRSTEIWSGGNWIDSVNDYLPKPLASHCMTKLNNTGFLVGGWTEMNGLRYVTNETWIYEGRNFSQKADIPIKRFSHSCAVLGNQIFVVGGQGQYSGLLKSTQIFDLATSQWTNGPDLPVPTTGGQLVNIQGTLLFIGGEIGDASLRHTTNNIYKLVYPPAWKKVETNMNPRSYFNAIIWEGCQ